MHETEILSDVLLKPAKSLLKRNINLYLSIHILTDQAYLSQILGDISHRVTEIDRKWSSAGAFLYVAYFIWFTHSISSVCLPFTDSTVKYNFDSKWVKIQNIKNI